jgi:hypothetical protein
MKKRIIFIFKVALIFYIFTGCGNDPEHKKYWVTIEKVGSLKVISKEKVSSMYGYHYNSAMIGILMRYHGKINSIDNPLVPYPCNKMLEYKEKLSQFAYKLNSYMHIVTSDKNESIVLLPKTALVEINILDNNKANKDLCIESLYQNNKTIPREKYIIKITQEEMNKALEELDEVSEK